MEETLLYGECSYSAAQAHGAHASVRVISVLIEHSAHASVLSDVDGVRCASASRRSTPPSV
jgi:hypothetical protein